MYGSQAWALDACHIKSFCSAWRKSIRKLWRLPNIARSALVPHLVNAPLIEDQLYQRTVKMYNGIRKGHNPKLLLLLQLSINADGCMASTSWNATLSKAKAKKLPELLWSRISLLARSPDSQVIRCLKWRISQPVINFCPLLSSCMLISQMM